MTTPPRHTAQPALELEFFVPRAVWDHHATKAFLREVLAFVEGATIIGNASGVWQGESESTNLVRVMVRKQDVQFDGVLEQIRGGVDRLMRAWNESPQHRQESFLFTARELTAYETR